MPKISLKTWLLIGVVLSGAFMCFAFLWKQGQAVVYVPAPVEEETEKPAPPPEKEKEKNEGFEGDYNCSSRNHVEKVENFTNQFGNPADGRNVGYNSGKILGTCGRR